MIIAVVLVLVLAGTIAVVLSLGVNQPPSGSAKSGPSASAEPTLGPEVPIPAIGPTIPVGNPPVFVAVTPNGHHVYVANRDTQVITVLDTAVNQVTATIPVQAGPPRFLAFAPDGHTLYVTIYNEQRTIHSIDVIDTGPTGPAPSCIAVLPNSRQAYVSNSAGGTLTVLELAG